MGFQRHELSAKFSDNKGSDPVGLVLGKNLHRRHLTPIQRAELVVGCRKWAAGGRPKTVQPVSKPATNEDMARQVQAEITKEIAQARAEGDRDAEDKTRDKLRAWNEKNPDSPIRIDAKAIATQARQIK